MFASVKRMLAAAMALCLVAILIPVQAAAVDGSCGDNLTWSLENGTLTISGTGDMYDYTESQTNWNPETPWYAYSNEIQTVVVEEGVTSIGNFAFCKLWGVTSITLPGSLTRLGDNALGFLSNVTDDLVFSDNLMELGYRALVGVGATRITVPNPNAVFADESVGYAWDTDSGGWAVNPAVILCGLTGSTAEEYAERFGISFESTGEIPPPPPKEPVLNHDGCIITPAEAVDEMTWGVNLCSLFMTNPNIIDSTTGYCTTAPFGLAMWDEGGGFEWLAYNDFHTGTFPVEAKLGTCPTSQDKDLMRLAVLTTLKGQQFTLKFEDSKLTKTDGTVLFLTSLNGTHVLTADYGPDINGWCDGFLDIGADLPKSDASFSGATFSANVTVIKAEFASLEDKANTLYEFNQGRMDQEELTEVYLEQGCNVFRLPVTWTPFVDDKTFKIDPEWLELVQSEVDYILSRGAYCILNTHSDYLNCSFVGTHWEDQWMEEQYQDYVDRRFTAIWQQIAECFKDYPQTLIFEPFNEPTMNWYYGVDFENWKLRQAQRINGMNQLFVNTVRNTGGGNATRFLCLPTADYCNHEYLKNLILPNDPYLMVQLHSYSEMEDNINQSANPDFDYQTEIDKLFSDVTAFQKIYPDVPVIVGEVGITQLNDAYAEERVSYFYRQAEAHGVPCLWWEDGYTNSFSMYVIKSKTWERNHVLAAIQGEIVEPLRLTVSVNDKDCYLTSPLTRDCTVVAGVFDESGRLLGCSSAGRRSSDTALTLKVSLSDCPEEYKVKVFILENGSYAPTCVPLNRVISIQ